MKQVTKKIKSKVLGETLNAKVYGEKGYPVIVFQTQDQKADDFEKGGMVDALASYVETGKLQLFSVDSIDEESWSNTQASNEERIERQERYFEFVTGELLDLVHKTNGSDVRPLVMGCSMGAVHAAIAFLRRPDLFEGNISLSGVYHTGYFFGDWMNDVAYANDVLASLSGMAADHPYVELYNQRSILFCTGAGLGEEGYADTQRVDAELTRLGVDHWCDFWGDDVEHNFAWWQKQIEYFMPYVIEDVEKHQPGVFEALATKKAAAKKPAAKKAPAKKATTKKAATKKVEAAKDEVASVVEPTVKKAAEPVDEAPKAEAKPAAKPAAKKAPAKKAATKKAEVASAVEPAAEKAAEPVAKSAAKKAAEPVVEAPKPEAKPAAKPAAKKAPAKKAEPVIEKTVENVEVKAPAEKIVEAEVLKAETKPATKKAPAKKSVKAATKSKKPSKRK